MIWFLVWLVIPGTILIGLALRFQVQARAGEYDDFVLDHGWAFAAYIAGGSLVVIGLIFCMVVYGERITCRNQANNIGVPWRYSVSAGCLYQINGTYFPSDQIRMVNGQIQVQP